MRLGKANACDAEWNSMNRIFKSESTAERTACYHCGDACSTSHPVFDQKDFCCDGCKLVYELLNENKLCSYYAIEPGGGNSPKNAAANGRFAFLEEPEVQKALLQFANAEQHRVTLYIPGMHCRSCIWLLENLQRLNTGVLNSSVDFPRRELCIVFKPDKTSLSSIAEMLAQIGYEPHISLHEIQGQKRRGNSRKQWLKIGVAGFCFGNIMMLSFPEYLSMNPEEYPEIKTAFSSISLVLALPVLFYSAVDFFRSAWSALRNRTLNIDLPIAAAIALTFIRSLYEIVSSVGAGYLDSMSGIVFFMLIGRAFQNTTSSNLAFDRDYRSYFPIAVTTLNSDGTEQQVLVNTVKKGMQMRIRNGEVVPADSVLLSAEARIDYSFVTGESHPVPVKKGELVYAGGRQTEASIELEIIKPVEHSYLTQLWNHKAFSKDNAEAEKQETVNRINVWFTAALLILAAGTTLFWYAQGDYHRMFDSGTTLLIVACPCILLLASGFADGQALNILGKNGLYLKNAHVIDRLARATACVFDKTGTITQQQKVNCEYNGLQLSTHELHCVRALAHQSTHPYSMQIAAIELSTVEFIPSEFKSIDGAGIEGVVESLRIRLGSASFVGAATESQRANGRVYFSINGEQKGYFAFEQVLRRGISNLIQDLQTKFNLYLLSGDTDDVREQFLPLFANERMMFNQMPEDKVNFIEKLQREGLSVIMLGDGLNDAGALKQSNVGIAVSDDKSSFAPASDALLDGSRIQRLGAMLAFCKDSRNIIKLAFAFSLFYNAVGLYFALQGTLQPVIAALLMPLTSITIVGFTTLAGKWAALRRGL
jgi:Cu+-exporting ATPase